MDGLKDSDVAQFPIRLKAYKLISELKKNVVCYLKEDHQNEPPNETSFLELLSGLDRMRSML
jgi:hypothetical protein